LNQALRNKLVEAIKECIDLRLNRLSHSQFRNQLDIFSLKTREYRNTDFKLKFLTLLFSVTGNCALPGFSSTSCMMPNTSVSTQNVKSKPKSVMSWSRIHWKRWNKINISNDKRFNFKPAGFEHIPGQWKPHRGNWLEYLTIK
jgi:hypothetical protein